jgi:hypothetical protein
MKKKIATLIASVALTMGLVGVLGVAGIAPTPAAEAACSGAQITLYANTNGGGGSITFCMNVNKPDLTKVATNPSFGVCGLFSGTWNDCASSIRFRELGTDTAVCLWSNINYGGNGLRIISDVGVYNLPSWMHDAASSVEWGNGCLN